MTVQSRRLGYIKKLEWAISLSQKNLRGLREGDWLNLREDLYEFVYDEKIPADHRKEIFFKKATRETIEAIQQEFGSRFNQCVDMYAAWKRTGLKEGVFAPRPIDVTKGRVHLTAWAPDLSFHQSFEYEDLKTGALIQVDKTLEVSDLLMSQIRRCPNADCNRLFLLRMKPRADRNFYCSPRCSGLAATRKYRKEKAEELKAKARSRYKRKQRQQFGARTKVGRGKL